MMKNQFVLLQATRDLENYISRERYNLSKMETNYNVPHSLVVTKVEHFNHLVNTLNTLFGSLVGTDERLFEPYLLEGEDAEEFSYQETTHQEESTDDDTDDDSTTDVEEPVHDTEDVDELGMPIEQSDEVDVNDDEDLQESEETQDLSEFEVKHRSDIDLENFDDGVQDEISMKSANDMLTDYELTSEQDISSYDPELDEPAEVLQLMSDDDSEDEEDTNGIKLLSEENISYLNHTADNQRVNDDPIQIANTLTAVEKHGGKSKIEGADTHLTDLLDSNMVSIDVDNLIKDDFDKLYVGRSDTDDELSDEENTEEYVESDEYEHDESEEVFIDSDEDFVLEDEHHDDDHDDDNEYIEEDAEDDEGVSYDG